MVFTPRLVATQGIACDQAGNIYVWDSGNELIRRIDQNHNVTTIATVNMLASTRMGLEQPRLSLLFMRWKRMHARNVFLACGSCIRKFDASTNVLTVAGSFSQGSYANGAGAIARFNNASGLCLSQGMIFVADSGNQRIRSISFNPAPRQVTGPNLGVDTYATSRSRDVRHVSSSIIARHDKLEHGGNFF